MTDWSLIKSAALLPVETLMRGRSAGITNYYAENRIFFVGQLLSFSEKDIFKIKGMGKKNIVTLKDALENAGFASTFPSQDDAPYRIPYSFGWNMNRQSYIHAFNFEGNLLYSDTPEEFASFMEANKDFYQKVMQVDGDVFADYLAAVKKSEEPKRIGRSPTNVTRTPEGPFVPVLK